MVHAPDRVAAPPLPARDRPAPNATRAREPDATGFVDRDGVRIFYEVYGTGEPTVLLLPSWSIVHSRVWKAQIPDLARRHRVVTFDPRGNGRSDRPSTADAYAEREFAADALAVMAATDTERAVLVSLSRGAQRALILASDHPDRVLGAVFIAPSLPLDRPRGTPRSLVAFLAPPRTSEGWDTYNAVYWRAEYHAFIDFFFARCFTERHSTKPKEDCVGWAAETDAETLILSTVADGLVDREDVLERAARVRCPTLVIHGRDDDVVPYVIGEEFAWATGGRLLAIDGGGHLPNARDPIKVNLAVRDFARGLRR
ncbi:MAG TPA: alpha/beta hydrolase [Candidatus Limnocylindrales bacterium]|nr:alpha/beta hydrolase [Candidatus Limnocylindrales bacterium]